MKRNPQMLVMEIGKELGLLQGVESGAGNQFLALIKKRMDEMHETPQAALYAIALTAEGQSLWEEIRKPTLMAR